MSVITYDRLLPVTSHTFYIVWLSSRIHEEHTVVYYDRYRSQPMALYLLPVTTGYTWFTQLCICPRITLIIHGPVLRPIPVTINNFINNTGHCRRLYIRFTLLCETPQITLLLHGRILRPIPVTTQGFIFVSHYYWGAGRPKKVSVLIPTAVLCPPSGF